MSYSFDINGHSVWTPALRVGTIYVGYVRAVSDAYQVKSGLETIANDTADIAPEVFGPFIELLTGGLTDTNHSLLREQLQVVVLPGIVMLERGGFVIPDERLEAAGLVRIASDVARSMPQ
jgi:hypothetical protein